MKRLLALVFLLAASPALAGKSAVIYYANDMGAAITEEIRDHEIAHLVCPGWRHPKGYQANGKAWPPPPECLNRKPSFKVEEVSGSSSKIRERCKIIRGLAGLGCSIGPFKD